MKRWEPWLNKTLLLGKASSDALWKALNNNVVDIIASDHAPHTVDEKSKMYPDSPSGTPGVQTLVPIMLNHVNNGKLSLKKTCKLMELWTRAYSSNTQQR